MGTHTVETEQGLVVVKPRRVRGELQAWEVWEPGPAGRILGHVWPHADGRWAVHVDGEEYLYQRRTDGVRFLAGRGAERRRHGVEP